MLGNGKQRKCYLYVQDCVDAILTVIEKAQDQVNVFNLGTDEYCEVNDSIGWICDALGCHPERDYTGGDRGLDRRQPVHLSGHEQGPRARAGSRSSPSGRGFCAR